MPKTKFARVIICRSNPIDPDPRVEKVAQALVAAGFMVKVLGWDRTAKLPQQEKLNGIWISRLPIQADFGRGIQNFPALLRWQWHLLIWLLRHRREIDLIHACDFDTVLPALALKFIFQKKVIYDIFDFYADHLRATPAWIKRLIRWMDNWSINYVDGVIVVDEARWAQVPRALPRQSAVIYNTPKDILANLQADENQSDQNPFTIVYVGLLQRERGIFELINVVARHPEWRFHLAGFGGDEAEMIVLANQLSNVEWHGRIPYRQALQLSHSADIIFATYDPAVPNHRFASPNKVFEAMMLGKPLIVTHHTHIDQIVKKFDCGIVIPYGDEKALEKSLLLLSSDPQLRRQLGNKSRQAYEQNYQWSQMEARLLSLYQAVQFE